MKRRLCRGRLLNPSVALVGPYRTRQGSRGRVEAFFVRESTRTEGIGA